MVKRYINDASHSRYYVFRHKLAEVDGAPVEPHENLVEIGRADNFYWKPSEFSTSILMPLAAATLIANTAAEQGKLYNEKWIYCVGKVFVEVDGHFEIIVVK
jgi:hypothetical protein